MNDDNKQDNINQNNPLSENQVTNSTTPNLKKKKKKKHRFLKFILIIILIFISIKCFKAIGNYHSEKKFKEFIEQNMLIEPYEQIELTKEELELDYNSDGMTNAEKIEKGLSIISDDTDGDGLTDYDEIHKYGSDPTKYSTSGDILSDGYKILKGYDVNKYYKDAIKMKTQNSSITLTAEKATDTEAFYKEYTGSVPSEYSIAFTPFRIYSFTGQVEISIENPNYYDVISYDNIKKETTKVDHKTTDSSIIFSMSNDNPILIVYKDDILKKMEKSFNSKLNSFNNSKDSDYILIAMPIFNVFFDVPIYVFEVNNNLFKNNNNLVLQETLNNKSNGVFKVVVSYINTFGAKVLDFFFGRLQNQLATYVDSENSSWISYIFIYKHIYSGVDLENYLYGDGTTNDEKTPEETQENVKYDFENKYDNNKGNYYADSGFSVYKNAYNFSNLSTNVSNGGVCLGFAHFTTNVYNNGKISKSIKNVYDMSNSNYTTIWNKNLYNYQTSSDLSKYADDISGNEPTLDSASMKAPDSEVVKSLEYYWDTVNSKLRFKKFGWAWNSAGDKQTYIDSSTIDNVVNKFKNGEIVSLCLCADGQHAINAYKIVEDSEDSDILYLKAYDNNFPGDMWWNSDRNGKQKYDITITLKRCYKNTIFGTKEYYLYDYNPLNNDSYHYESIYGGTDYIIFIDENGNAL